MANKKKNSNYVTEKSADKKAAAAKKKQSEKNKALAKKIILWSVVAVLAIGAILAGLYFGGAFDYVPGGTEDLLITFEDDYGSLHVELYRNDAPETVKSFLTLVSGEYFKGKAINGYKDGNLYLGDDKATVDKKGVVGEFAANGKTNKVPFKVGTLVMARGEDYDSAYGRFFIVTEDTDVKALEGKYAAFGRITEGMEIIESIVKGIKADADGKIPVGEQIIIESISSHASHSH